MENLERTFGSQRSLKLCMLSEILSNFPSSTIPHLLLIDNLSSPHPSLLSTTVNGSSSLLI